MQVTPVHQMSVIDQMTPRQRLMLFWAIVLSTLFLSGCVFIALLSRLGAIQLTGILLGAGHICLMLVCWVWAYFALRKRGWAIGRTLVVCLIYAMAVPLPYWMFLQLPHIEAGGHFKPMLEQIVGMVLITMPCMAYLAWRESRDTTR